MHGLRAGGASNTMRSGSKDPGTKETPTPMSRSPRSRYGCENPDAELGVELGGDARPEAGSASGTALASPADSTLAFAHPRQIDQLVLGPPLEPDGARQTFS